MKSRRKSPGDTGTKYNRTQSQYNAFDQVKTSIDALNRNTTSTFDNLGRLKQTTAPAISGQANLTTYTYDLAGNMDRRFRTTFSLTNQVAGTPTTTLDSTNSYQRNPTVADRLDYVRQFTTSASKGQFATKDRRVVRLEYFNSGELQKITRWEGAVPTTNALTTTYGLANGGWINGQIGAVTHAGLTGTVTSFRRFASNFL